MVTSSTFTTIVAQCTPSGAGALALIRLSGPESIRIISACSQCSSGRSIEEVETHTIHHGYVGEKQDLKKGIFLDEVLFFVMHAPRTFTGESTVEITCHNNPFIIESIIMLLIAHGARLAQPGEFSRRAVENGKLDLLQAEAINELVHANTQQTLKLALAQRRGSLSHEIGLLEEATLRLMAFCEASFEFLEEEVDFSTTMREQFSNLTQKTVSLLDQFDHQRVLREGIRIALIGTVNAGKSSLFNALIKKKRAIVTAIAGTTRDVIESGTYLFGTYITFIDTAGLRLTDDSIEKEGIERSFQEAQKADLILLIADGSRPFTKDEATLYQSLLKEHHTKIILIINKNDLPQHLDESLFIQSKNPLLKLSAEKTQGIENLLHTLEDHIKNLFSKTTCPFLLTKRQLELLKTFFHAIKETEPLLFSPIVPYELVAFHLKEALVILSELTGKSITEKVLDQVFSSFCVGK